MAARRPDKHFVFILVTILVVFGIYVKVWSTERYSVLMRQAIVAAKQAAQGGQIDNVMIQLSNAINYGADLETFGYQRAVVEQMSGHLFLAEGDYKHLIQLNPKNIRALVNLSEIEFRLDDFANAFRHAEQALKLDPQNPSALTVRAMCYIQRHEYAKAVSDTTDALSNIAANNPARIAILVRRAAAYRYLGRSAEAQQDIATARAIFQAKVTTKSTDVFESHFKRKYVLPRFTFYSNYTDPVNAQYIEFCQRFLAYVDENLIPQKKDPNFRIFMFHDAQDYQKVLAENKMRAVPTGNYSPAYDAVFTYDQTDRGMFGRLLMMKATANMPFTDPWATLGIPDLLERFYGYPEGDGYYMYLGLQKPWLDELLRKRVFSINLPETVAQQFPGMTDSEGRLAAVFLYRHGKLHKFLELCRNGEVDQHVTLFETALGKSAVELSPEWTNYLVDFEKHNLQIAHLPSSMIFMRQELLTNFLGLLPPGTAPPPPADMKPLPTKAPKQPANSGSK